jgi:uncharacterized protein YndB with AHSA1/START domain
MSDAETELVFETVLDAPPEKIWRALTIPEYRDRWLQPPDGVSLNLVTLNAHSLLTYSWQERRDDDESGTEQSFVTIELTPYENGTTGFRLTHAPVLVPAAANSNEATAMMMRAA